MSQYILKKAEADHTELSAVEESVLLRSWIYKGLRWRNMSASYILFFSHRPSSRFKQNKIFGAPNNIPRQTLSKTTQNVSLRRHTYLNCTGPGDSRPTAMDIIRDEDLVNKLTDKTALVTGGNAAVGLETARALHAAGMTVFIASRSVEKGEAAIKDMQTSNPSSTAPLHVVQLSLDSFASVRKAAAGLPVPLQATQHPSLQRRRHGHARGPHGRRFRNPVRHKPPRPVPALLPAPRHLTRLLHAAVPLARRGPDLSRPPRLRHPARRLQLRVNPVRPVARVRPGQDGEHLNMANEIERRYGARGLHGLSVHPGAIRSNLSQYVDPAVTAEWDENVRLWRSAAQGAATSVYAALSREWEGKGGKYLADCVEHGHMVPGNPMVVLNEEGYAPWAYDVESARRLWRDSCRFVGVEDDEVAN